MHNRNIFILCLYEHVHIKDIVLDSHSNTHVFLSLNGLEDAAMPVSRGSPRRCSWQYCTSWAAAAEIWHTHTHHSSVNQTNITETQDIIHWCMSCPKAGDCWGGKWLEFIRFYLYVIQSDLQMIYNVMQKTIQLV